MPRIALIHAVTVAMEPVQAAFREHWPEAECVNILDDSLSPDRAKDDGLTPAMRGRIGQLAHYAHGLGSDGILFTCSAFGEAIESAAAALSVPVLKPNEAMFEAALSAGSEIGMLATFRPSVDGMEAEFRKTARLHGSRATIRTVLVEDAMTALKRGDAAEHNRLLAEAAPRLAGCAAIMLAHFSTSRAEEAVKSAAPVPVLTSPGAAVDKLRRVLAQ